MKMAQLGAGVRTLDTSTVKPLTDSAPRLRGRAGVSRRERIALRDQYTCQHCNAIALLDEGRVDHIVPLVDGGVDEDGNLQYLCRECHDLKTASEAAARATPGGA